MIFFKIYQEKIVKKLASSDPEEQKHGQILADEILETKPTKDFSEDEELKVKVNRTVINKYSKDENITDEQMSQGINYSFSYY